MLPSRIDSGVLNPATLATRPLTAPAEKIGPTASDWPTAWIVLSLRGTELRHRAHRFLLALP